MATTSFSASSQPGIWAGANVVLPAIPAGTLLYFQVFVHELTDLDPYLGRSVIFTGATGSAAYNSITTSWPVGDFPMDTYGPGSRGAPTLQRFNGFNAVCPFVLAPDLA